MHECIYNFQNEKEIDRLEGANAPELTKKVRHHANTFVAPVVNTKSDKKEVSAMQYPFDSLHQGPLPFFFPLLFPND